MVLNAMLLILLLFQEFWVLYIGLILVEAYSSILIDPKYSLCRDVRFLAYSLFTIYSSKELKFLLAPHV